MEKIEKILIVTTILCIILCSIILFCFGAYFKKLQTNHNILYNFSNTIDISK